MWTTGVNMRIMQLNNSVKNKYRGLIYVILKIFKIYLMAEKSSCILVAVFKPR